MKLTEKIKKEIEQVINDMCEDSGVLRDSLFSKYGKYVPSKIQEARGKICYWLNRRGYERKHVCETLNMQYNRLVYYESKYRSSKNRMEDEYEKLERECIKLSAEKELIKSPANKKNDNQPICKVFGCSRKLSLQETLFGDKCIHHQKQTPLDVTNVISW